MTYSDHSTDVAHSVPNPAALSPGAVYYLRKLLRQNIDQLAFIVAEGAGIKADPLGDLNAVIESLYLEPEEISEAVEKLERLVLMHQNLINQGSKHRQQLRETEEQLFWLLGFKAKTPAHQGTVLIVDDVPENLRLLSAALSKHGFEVPSAINGALALSAARELMPDLILLDIMMPGMDGYEVCTRLKADTVTRDIPVIFVSAVDDPLDKVRAFESGGVDYVTKPFQIEEVLARVENQLKIRDLQKRLESQNARLQGEIQERKQAEKQYRTIFENSGDGMFQSTAAGQYLQVNSALAAMYGYDSPESLMQTITNIEKQLYVKAGQREKINAYLQQFGQISDAKSEVYCKDGSTIWIAEKIREVRDERGNLLCYEGTVQNITERKHIELELKQQREETERLRQSLFPEVLWYRQGEAIAPPTHLPTAPLGEAFDGITVLSADLGPCPNWVHQLPPAALVQWMTRLFDAFDRLTAEAGLQRIKTLGEVYLVAGGLGADPQQQGRAVMELAIALQKTMPQFQQEGQEPLRLRIGLSVGRAIAGIVGSQRLSYDLWGYPVDMAHQMRRLGMPGGVQVCPQLYQQLQGQFSFKERGQLQVPGVGELTTYWLRGKAA